MKKSGQSKLIILGVALIILAGLLVVRSNRPKKLPNIIFISLDTLRRDAVDVYSTSVANNTKNIDNFAKDSIVFDRAYAPMPFTPSSHMSMFTGVYPSVHGLLGKGLKSRSGSQKETILPASIKTLPEILNKLGYECTGFFSSNWLKAGFGFGRGFREYIRVHRGADHFFAGEINKKAIAILTKYKNSEKPFFLFLHYYDIHSDFNSDAPPYTTSKDFQINNYTQASKEFCDNDKKCATYFLLKANKTGEPIGSQKINLLHDLYLGGVKYTDQQLGLLFNKLKKMGIYRNSLIILTSDHGEEFREHGLFLHSQVYNQTCAVPLIFKLPKNVNAGMRIDNLICNISIMPSILGLIGRSQFIPRGIQGRDMSYAMYGKLNHDVKEGAVLLQDKIKLSKYALCYEQYKFIFDYKSKQMELYNLQKDSKESNNIATVKPMVSKRMLKMLDEKVAACRRKYNSMRGRDDAANVLTAKDKMRLKSLGYMH